MKSTQYKSPNGTPKSFSFQFHAPVQTVLKNFSNDTPIKLSKGIGINWGFAVTATSLIKEVSTNLGLDRIFTKCISAEEKHGDFNMVNKSLAELVDIPKEDDNTPLPILRKRKTEFEKKKPNLKPSLFSFEDLMPNKIHCQTGFSDLFCLLSYITTICSSDMTLISKA